MRIVGGEAGGRVIIAPQGMNTRPTSEKVREAVFSMLGGDMTGDRVFDVFAGSGAMALEALSRGADLAAMCDISPDACRVIRKNLTSLGFSDRARLFNRDWRAALSEFAGTRFTVVFIDPPYKKVEEYLDVTNELAARKLLNNHAVLVLEHSAKTVLSGFAPCYRLLKPHKYGETAVTALRYEEGEQT